MKKLFQVVVFCFLVIGIGACSSTSKQGDNNAVATEGFSGSSELDDLETGDAKDSMSETKSQATETSKDEFAELEKENEANIEQELNASGSEGGNADNSFAENGMQQDQTPPPPPPEPAPSQNVDEDLLSQNSFPESAPETSMEQAPTPTEPSPAESSTNALADEAVTTSHGSNTITNIRFLPNENGGTVAIDTSQPANYKTRVNAENNQFVIEFPDANLPSKLKRPYNTRDFSGPIGSIDAYQNSGNSVARVVIQLRDPGVTPTVKQEGNSLLVLAGGEGGGVPSADSMAATEPEVDSAPTFTGNESKALTTSSVDEMADGNVKFYGSKISIEVVDTDIREVLKLIAKEKGINLVLSDGVDGKISVKFQDIPWDQAFLVILKSKKLGYVRQGNVIRVATLDSIKDETDMARKVADSRRQLEKVKTKIIPVSYAQVEDLEGQVKELLTSDRGKVKADKRTSSLIVTDVPDVIERIRIFVKALDVPPSQVLVEAKIVEVTESFQRAFGLNWGLNGTSISMGGSGNYTSNMNMTAGVKSASGITLDVGLGPLDKLGNWSAELALAEVEGIVKVISSPRILALHGEEAEISQDQQVPIIGSEKVDTAQNALPRDVSFKGVKTSLKIKPFVTGDNSILLNLDVQRQFAGEVVDQKTQAFPVNSRSAKTKILVHNGQTAVIGGIYQNDVSDTETGMPWLRKIPVIGYLFKSTFKKIGKNELLVFLTPRILSRGNDGTSQEGAMP